MIIHLFWIYTVANSAIFIILASLDKVQEELVILPRASALSAAAALAKSLALKFFM